MTREIEPPKHITEIIEKLMAKKQYRTQSDALESKIIGYSVCGEPGYLLRADYHKNSKDGREPVEYWDVPNPFTAYFKEKAIRVQSLKDLIEKEKEIGLETSTKHRYKQSKERFEFLLQPRKINPIELKDRMEHGYIQFIKHE